MTGSRIAERLTNLGLAPADSERMARQYSAEFSQCAANSLADEAQRLSISLDELVSRLQATVNNPELNVSDVIDLSRMEVNMLPCWIDAMQETGLSFESEIPALEESLFRAEQIRARVSPGKQGRMWRGRKG